MVRDASHHGQLSQCTTLRKKTIMDGETGYDNNNRNNNSNYFSSGGSKSNSGLHVLVATKSKDLNFSSNMNLTCNQYPVMYFQDDLSPKLSNGPLENASLKSLKLSPAKDSSSKTIMGPTLSMQGLRKQESRNMYKPVLKGKHYYVEPE